MASATTSLFDFDAVSIAGQHTAMSSCFFKQRYNETGVWRKFAPH